MYPIKNIVIIMVLVILPDIVAAQQDHEQKITYHPIGIFHTDFSTATGAPRQGVLLPETQGTIEIFEPYQEGLQLLELYEFIIVLYHFSEVESWEPLVNPPEASHEHDFGLFSTRSPKRPNPIGLLIVKLEKIENGILSISGVDAFDGTPVLDIKPYLPSIDCVKSVQNEMIEKILGHHDEDFITDSTFFK